MFYAIRIIDKEMSYDKAKWHFEGSFPTELPQENGGTHIGMYLAWVIINGLESEELQEDFAQEIEAVRNRKMTGRSFLFLMDGVFTEEDLNEEGNEFTEEYYQESGQYLKDYTKLFNDYPSIYYVEDTWENYQKVAQMINKRYKQWKKQQE